jgi:molybdopterin biosynthesis enzyme MoaB
MQSRALAGLANRTLICCLPGSTGACRLGWEQLVRDQLDARTAVQLCDPSVIGSKPGSSILFFDRCR